MVDTKIKLTDYVVIDIENPNLKANSICSIAFVQVKNNDIVKKEYTLINPEDNFDYVNMRVNKITPEMVKDSITFKDFWTKYKDVFEDAIIVGHGIRYDMSVICKSLLRYGIDLPNIKVICTQKLTQKYLDTNKYSLNAVCDYLNIKLDEHHNAMCDAMSSMQILDYINNKYGLDDSDIEDYHFNSNDNGSHNSIIKFTNETKDLQKLKRIIEGIMEDKKITFNEMEALEKWLDYNTHLIGNYPFDKIYTVVKNILDDGVISKGEHDDLVKIFNELIDPINEMKSDSTICFTDKMFCLTGTFNSGSKEEIEKKIIDKGGICSKTINSKVNYLIVGGAGSDDWKFGNYGSKVQKAMELKEKGKNIEIIGENDFLSQL